MESRFYCGEKKAIDGSNRSTKCLVLWLTKQFRLGLPVLMSPEKYVINDKQTVCSTSNISKTSQFYETQKYG